MAGVSELFADLWRDGWGGRVFATVVVGSIALTPIAVWKVWNLNKRWKDFAAAHECKKVAEVSADLNVGAGVVVTPGGGVGTVTTTTVVPGKTAWLCDDGVTYWR